MEIANQAGEVVGDRLIFRKVFSYRFQQLKRIMTALEIKQGVGLIDPAGRVARKPFHHVTAEFHAAFPILVLRVDVPLQVQYLEMSTIGF